MDYNRIIGICLIISTLFSCKAYKEKILNKYCKQDTIVRVDTVITESIQIDTTFVDHYMTDTLVLTKDKIIIRYIKKDSIIYLDGECLPDTIVKEIKVPCNTPQKVLSKWEEFKILATNYLAVLGLLALILLILYLILKK